MLLVIVAVMAGCSRTGSQSSADCAAQIRVADVVYTSSGTTGWKDTRHGTADQAECHDLGKNAAGSVFPEVPAQVRTWTFEDYSPEEVLGVRYGTDGFGVFIADTVPPEERKTIHADLSGQQ